jgi:metallo-beta-lactamase class B
MRLVPKRRWLQILLALAAIAIVFLGRAWKSASDHGGQKPAEPFRIAGNLHYVGANDVTSFLIAGPQGHVLIDGGYPGTAPLILKSIARLGFDIRDVKVILNSEPHFDHAGGLAALQKASGAELWASDASAKVLAARGVDPAMSFPARMLHRILRYPAPRVDRRLADGDVVRVGPLALTAHITAGHTRGCTSWSFVVREGDRDLNVVSACSLVMLEMARYPGQRADFERTFRVLRGLPVDVWVTAHARDFGRYRKFVARAAAKSPADPFIDPAGYRAWIDRGEARFRAGLRQ